MRDELYYFISLVFIVLFVTIIIIVCNRENKTNNYPDLVLETDFIEIKEQNMLRTLKSDKLPYPLDEANFCNLSVIKNKNFQGFVRLWNSNQPQPHYSLPFYVEIDEIGNLLNMYLLDLDYENMTGDITANGFEDPKIFIYRNKIWVSGTCLIYKKQTVKKMAIFQLDNPKETFVILEPPGHKTEIEKNWTFFEIDGELLCEYSLSPHIILKINVKTGECVEFCRTETKKYLDMRLNSNPIILDETSYLGVGHITTDRNYSHFFYTFEKHFPFKITNISKLFKLDDNERIQFVGGISKEQGYIYISYGVEDKKNRISKIKLDEVLEMLECYNLDQYK